MYGDSSNIKKRDPNKASLGIRNYKSNTTLIHIWILPRHTEPVFFLCMLLFFKDGIMYSNMEPSL